ncbi:MAG: hypothetical protein NZ775_03540 [Gammaproteobacteria bacterium]|nr:hypothetical protein [Gammaproteobacteria bacterium]
MKKPDYWQKSLDYLCHKDKKLAIIINKYNDCAFSADKSALESLLGSITSQQISVKAAASIWQRVVSLVGEITAPNVINAGADKLRQCGLSGRKAQYFVNIAEHFRAHQVYDKSHWKNRDYSNVYDELIQIKGVGPWTIEMFGMFYLMEKDILPLKDVGIIRAINQLYSGGNKGLEISEIIEISNRWSPYRTIASLFLWRSIDD